MQKFAQTLVGRVVILGVFFLLGIAIYAYLYVGVGGYVPFYRASQYTASLRVADGGNLVTASHVSLAGIQIGEVRSVENDGDKLKVTFEVDSKYAPLHEGVKVRIGERSLVGETYLDVLDGKGATLPKDAVIPADHVQPIVELHEILQSLDAPTRASFTSMLRQLGGGTEGTQKSVDALYSGLGGLGRGGNTALDAIAAQSDDFRALGHDLSTLFNALDTGQGQIADLVSSTEKLTRATSGQKEAVEATFRTLPRTLDSVAGASGELSKLSNALAPVAVSLRDASPFLTDAFDKGKLPSSTKNLHGFLPPLNGTIDASQPVFDAVPEFGDKTRDLIPDAEDFTRDLNPLVHYLKPYGHEFASFFSNFNSIMQYTDESGANYIRLLPELNDHSAQTPLNYKGPITYRNPYPKAGSQPNPGPFVGPYPHVERLPK